MYPEWRRWLSVLVLLFSLSPPLAQGQVSLPIEGKGSIGGNSGSFTNSISITVPPGRRGLTPGLGLTYNSSGGNGFLGVGWDLPIGYVMRSTKNGVDYNCTSSAANPCFVFMLGGASSELIPRTDWCSDCYGAKIEGGFIKFRFINNSYWQAVDKAGTTYTFGQNPTTKYSQQSGPPGIFKWALETVTDTHNNTISYSYFNDQGEIYPDTVDYQSNRIVFVRDSGNRPDKPTLFGPNFAVTTAYRLSEIKIYSNWNGTTGTLNRKYVLGYCGEGASCAVSNTGRSILGKVTQYGSDGDTPGAKALPETTFVSKNVAVNWTTSTWAGYSPTSALGYRCFGGDLNGDGKTDSWCETNSSSGSWDVFLSTGSGWTQPSPWTGPAIPFPVSDRCFTGDLNGDAKADMWCQAPSGSSIWDIWLSTGTGWSLASWSGSSSGPSTSFPAGQCLTGDLDGNGKTDFWCQSESSPGNWDVRLSTGTGWSAPALQSGPAPNFPVSNQCLSGDLNGDGRTDFWCWINGWKIALSNGTGWQTPLPSWSGPTPGIPVENRCFTGDLNGDGKTDFWCQTGNSTGLWDIRFSTGSSWFTPTSSPWSGPAIALPVGNQCRSGDLDGDGKTDFWCQTAIGSGSWDLRISTGSGWTAKQLNGTVINNPWSSKPSLNTPRQRLGVGVVNGTLYAVGGSDSSFSPRNTVEAYNPDTDTAWTNKLSMAVARDELAVGVVNGKLYAVGGVGVNSTYPNTVEEYNPAANSWTNKAPMPTPRRGLAVGVVNGILYAVGGRGSNLAYLGTVEAYDPVANTWTPKASMPTPRSRLAVAVVNGKLYAIGGRNDTSGALSTVEMYDPATNTWTAKEPMPPARDVTSGVGVVNGILYVITTGTGAPSSFDVLMVYDPITNTWTDNVQMPTERYGLAGGVVNETLYMVGGFTNASGVVGTVQVFTPTDMNPCREGDLDGDGKIDFWCHQSSGNWKITRMNTGTSEIDTGISDLLIGVSNGIGGNTSIFYKPSSAYWISSDIGWNLPFINQNVDRISVCDNYNGVPCVQSSTVNVSNTSYTYKGAYYNAPAREFRGYASIKATNIENNNTTETFYHQGNGVTVAADNGSDLEGYTAGRPYRIIVNDNAGVNRSKKELLYASDEGGGAPYFTPLQQENSWFCDTATSCKQTEAVYTYDHTNGNLTREDHKGDLSSTVDDRTVTRSFSPNTTTWILGLPTSEVIYKGISMAAADRVAQTDFYYDESTSCTAPLSSHTAVPHIKGDLTTVVRWLNVGGASPEAQTVYDASGNVTCTWDANGKKTTLSYDGSSTFPKIVTNALGHQMTTQYYGVDGVAADNGLYGQVKSVTDPNAKVTTTTYDKFGRKIQVTSPDGGSTSWSYPCVSATGCTPDATNLFGAVGSQYVKTTTSTEATTTLSSWVYFDGLGRTIKEKKTGPDNKLIIVDTHYNNLGQVDSKTLPYFEGQGTNGSTTYAYDVIGRQQQITYADNTAQVPVRTLFCYLLWSSGTIDPNNHLRWETKDAYGRLRNVYEFTGTYTACPTSDPTAAAYATTTYQYDVLGNLLYVTDADGRITSIQYDSLSRKISMNDPDVGNVSYTYDGVGNLKTQTDAKGQVITFEYDALNRVKTKTTSSNNPILTLTKTGSGAGSVTSSPTGINCGAICSASFISGTSVTLSATATSGSTFAGFSGGCTSATTPCTFTITSSATVTATFNDTTPPTISGVASSSITSSGTTITWSTDEASDSQVEFGTTTSYGSSSPQNTALVTSHSVTLSGLSPSTLYNYRVKSRDAAGNLATSGNFTFTTASSSGGPDLNQLWVAISTITSSSITINDVVGNFGTVSAGAFDVGFYLSTDTSYQSTDTFLCKRSVSGLAPETYSPPSGTAATTCSISGIASGSYYLLAVADSGQVVAETNETNNTFSTGAPIGPDLIVSGIYATKSSNTLTIQSAAKNQGNRDSGAFDLGFYLSTDTALDTASDHFVCKRSIASLAVGASDPPSSVTTISCTLPAVPAGSYYVIGFADSTRVITEYNENNNTQTGAFISIP